MNNRDGMEVKLEILQKENQEIKLLPEQERTLMDKLKIKSAKRNEAMLKAYTEKPAMLIKQNVKVKAKEIEHNVNNEDLNMKYGTLQRSHKKVEAKMALRKANQELKQLKLRCVEEKDAEIVTLHERNHELEQQKEVNNAVIVFFHNRNHKLEQQKERCVQEIAALKTLQRRTFINSFSCIRPNVADEENTRFVSRLFLLFLFRCLRIE